MPNTSKQQDWKKRAKKGYTEYTQKIKCPYKASHNHNLKYWIPFIQQEINNAYDQAAEVARKHIILPEHTFEHELHNQACEDIAEDIIKLKK